MPSDFLVSKKDITRYNLLYNSKLFVVDNVENEIICYSCTFLLNTCIRISFKYICFMFLPNIGSFK